MEIRQAAQDVASVLRTRSFDEILNKKTSRRIELGKLVDVVWEDIRVGDIVCVKDGEEVPADLVLLSCSNGYGIAWADTSSWLGSRDYQLKQAVKQTKGKLE